MLVYIEKFPKTTHIKILNINLPRNCVRIVVDAGMQIGLVIPE